MARKPKPFEYSSDAEPGITRIARGDGFAYFRPHGNEIRRESEVARIASLAIPPNTGLVRIIYVAPLLAIAAGGVGIVLLVRRWRKRSPGGGSSGNGDDKKTDKDEKKASSTKDEYDRRLDDELRELDD